MKITVLDIEKAMRMVDNPREWLNCDALHKQIAMSLDRYQTREEFDGSFESAVECLIQSCYIDSKDEIVGL